MATPQSQPISTRPEEKSGLGPTPFPPPLKPPYDISLGYYFYNGTDLYTACRDFQDVQAVTRITFGHHESSGNAPLPHQPTEPIIGAEGYPLLGSAALLSGSQALEIRPSTYGKTAVNKVEDSIERGFGLLLQRQEKNGNNPRVWGMEKARARALLRHSARVLADAAWTARARRTWGAVGDERARMASMTATTAAVEGGRMTQADREARGGPTELEVGAAVDGGDANRDGDDGDEEYDEEEEEDGEDDEDYEEDDEEEDRDVRLATYFRRLGL
jgi:hypothetical protein